MPAGVVIKHNGFQIAGQRFGGSCVVVQNTCVKAHYAVDKRYFKVQTGFINTVFRFAELQNYGLLRLVHDKKGL